MIIIKSQKEIEIMREAGKIVAETHEILKSAIIPGISTLELDKIAEENIRKYNAIRIWWFSRFYMCFYK